MGRHSGSATSRSVLSLFGGERLWRSYVARCGGGRWEVGRQRDYTHRVFEKRPARGANWRAGLWGPHVRQTAPPHHDSAFREFAFHNADAAQGHPMTAAVAKLRECLALQNAACDNGQRILQLCVIDHATGHGSIPHLHLQFHLGHTRSTHTSPWTAVHHVTLADLRSAVHAEPACSRTRLHIHPSNGDSNARSAPEPTQRSFVEELPRGKLSDASLLADRTCPVCIECFNAGDELVVLPCQGLHVSHWACLQPWLATAHTCPACRFELPTAKPATSESGAAPMEKAWAEMRRLQVAPPSRPAAIPLLVGAPVPRAGDGSWVVVPGEPCTSPVTSADSVRRYVRGRLVPRARWSSRGSVDC